MRCQVLFCTITMGEDGVMTMKMRHHVDSDALRTPFLGVPLLSARAKSYVGSKYITYRQPGMSVIIEAVTSR